MSALRPTSAAAPRTPAAAHWARRPATDVVAPVAFALVAAATLAGPPAAAQDSWAATLQRTQLLARAIEGDRPAVHAILGPLQLVAPLDPATVARVLDEAEATYRSRDARHAMAAFESLVELDPGNGHAWLRIGNLHHQAGRLHEALDAYAVAGRTDAASPPALPTRLADPPVARGKALLNTALLHLSEAGRALDDLDGLEPAELAATRDAFAREALAQQRRIDRFGLRHEVPRADLPPAADPRAAAPRLDPRTAEAWRRAVPAAAVPAAAVPARPLAAPASPPTAFPTAAPAAAPATASFPPVAPPAAPASAHEPYTIDRWAGRPRRPGARVEPARGGLHEPVTEQPLPAPPRVDLYRGGPGGGLPPPRR
jgi:tetratricopeptide (TPR) repeat protein